MYEAKNISKMHIIGLDIRKIKALCLMEYLDFGPLYLAAKSNQEVDVKTASCNLLKTQLHFSVGKKIVGGAVWLVNGDKNNRL